MHCAVCKLENGCKGLNYRPLALSCSGQVYWLLPVGENKTKTGRQMNIYTDGMINNTALLYNRRRGVLAVILVPSVVQSPCSLSRSCFSSAISIFKSITTILSALPSTAADRFGLKYSSDPDRSTDRLK